MTFSSDPWHIHFRKPSIVRQFLVSDILANTCQWPPEKVTYTWYKEIDYLESLLWMLMDWVYNRDWGRGSFVFLFLCSVFLYGVIHCLTLVNLFELFLMTGVIGAHLSVIFTGLIVFQRHLEHESLVHYESGILHGIVRHQSFLTTLACGHLKINGHWRP